MNRKKTGVLFVCLGNICRSPMAEAVFRHLVRQEGLEEQYHIDSAGTGDWHIGEPPHHGTRSLLTQKKISHEGLRARQVTAEDLEHFDYIIAMDTKNEADLKQLGKVTDAKILKLLDLVPAVESSDVPDPYYTGNFEEVYELVDKGCRALLKVIQQSELSN